MNIKYLKSLLLVGLSVLLLGYVLLGIMMVPKPTSAYVSTTITGEYLIDPFRGPDVKYYTQTGTPDKTLTSVALSTACPDIDAYMIHYADPAIEITTNNKFSVPLGTVTANEVTLTRTATTVADEVVIYTFIDYAAL